MSDDNNDDGQKGLGAEFERLMGQRQEMTAAEQFKEMAAHLLPVVRDVRQDPSTTFMIEMITDQVHMQMTSVDRLQLMNASFKIRQAATPEEIRAKLSEITGGMNDPLKAEKSARSSKDIVAGLTKAEYIRFEKAVTAVLPERLVKLIDETSGYTAANREQRLSDEYDKIAATSIDDLALERAAKAGLFPMDQLVDAVEDIVQKVTPTSLGTLVSKFAAAVSAQDMANVATKGLAFIEEFLENAQNDKPFNGTYSAEAKAFGPAVHKVLQAVEDSAVLAGLTVADDKMKALKAGLAAYGAYGRKGPSI
jgi:hypothetical protein